MVLIGALAAPFVVCLRRALPESPRWLAQHGRLAEADRVLRAIEAKVEADTAARCRARPARRSRRRAGSWISGAGVSQPHRHDDVFNIFQTVGFYGFAMGADVFHQQGITITTSLGYTTVIALAAPIGPLIGVFSATGSSANG